MRETFMLVAVVSLVIHVAMIFIAVQRVWRGETVMDRIVAADVIATLVLAIFVLLALLNDNPRYMDLALGASAISYVGTIALARYIANRQMF
ncbi:MAG: cation:proton antiporter [Chloroflexi bacterium]|jgi:multisubunit Na+/H+ antiporter MnhF subunit|uniref:Cation:proton antiporter n=1 Tax=Candidatus Thermofonsia Clade 3 bacterium TaxID=2364212 RepID=A0A2M8QCC6_9CHLR|nr:monovalent cation/H+ antiporter complex subunit F [Candidatus Roseilinea sp. NK_OTU-006]PJF47459.1 MAG: cation:proton antiporter [Candidatus Thermofonsia Clade 3 bacterium]RMG65342.1 MAG: cation:proton antiporter [Chloroflexota bacterium]